MTPSHFHNNCWLLIDNVFSSENIFTDVSKNTIAYIEFVDHSFEIIATSHLGQWVDVEYFFSDTWDPDHFRWLIDDGNLGNS